MGNTKIKKNDVISASEIGQYYFCPRSWYLQRSGYKPDSIMLDFGRDKHAELGKIMYYAERNKKRSSFLSYIGFILFFTAILILLLEVML